ncbi:MAG: glycoside hydrolase [Lentisphaeria bacterium]|nr:glycoside hydrolase [Lentisphaeria bacterium]
MRIDVSEPIAAVVAPPDEGGWGWYQFPTIERVPTGELLIQFQLWADTQTSAGTSRGKAISSDAGKTWRVVTDVPSYHDYHNGWSPSLHLQDGDMLSAISLPSPSLNDFDLPKPVGQDESSYGFTRNWYLAESLPNDLASWYFVRWHKKKKEWIRETAEMRIPGEIVFSSVKEEVLRRKHMDRIKYAPDGSIWGIRYDKRYVDGKIQAKYNVMILRSTDDGHSWDLHSEIPYHGDSEADPDWPKQEGFSEPDVAFLPNGSAFCLMRTTYGLGPAPLYSAHSVDDGKTWSIPEVYDDMGVWPRLLALNCGVTLSSYGRPGLYLRATDDPSGREWQERMTIVEPGEIHTDTCSYSALMALDDNTALLVYSDFRHKGEDGSTRKAIQVRRVTISM